MKYELTLYGDLQLKLNKIHSSVSDNTIYLSNELVLDLHKYVPMKEPFLSIYRCSGIQKGFEFMWWRAISATYLLRPNRLTLAEIEKHSDPVLRSVDGKCISTYVNSFHIFTNISLIFIS